MKTDTVYFVKNKYTIKAIEPIFLIKYNKIIAYLPWGGGGAHFARGRLFCLLWEYQGS